MYIYLAPLALNGTDGAAGKGTGTANVGGNEFVTTSGDGNVAVLAALEEDQSTSGGVAATDVLVSGRGLVPVNPGRGETREATAVGASHDLVAHSNVFGVASGRDVVDGPLDGSGAGAGVLDTGSLATTRGGRGGATAGGSSASISAGVDIGVGHVTAGNVVPDVGGTELASDGGTGSSAVNVDRSTVLDRADNGGGGGRARVDVQGVTSGADGTGGSLGGGNGGDKGGDGKSELHCCLFVLEVWLVG